MGPGAGPCPAALAPCAGPLRAVPFTGGFAVWFAGVGRVAAVRRWRACAGVVAVVAVADALVVLVPERAVPPAVFAAAVQSWLAVRPWAWLCPGLSAGLRG